MEEIAKDPVSCVASFVVKDLRVIRVLPSHKTSPGGHTDDPIGIGIGKARSALRQFVNVGCDDNGLDVNSTANAIHHESSDKGYDRHIIPSDRCCHFDSAVGLALHAMKFKRGTQKEN